MYGNEMLQNVLERAKLRFRGLSPALPDEVIKMFIIREYLGLGRDNKIWTYFKRYWQSWFYGLYCRIGFTRQAANLWIFQVKIQEKTFQELCQNKNRFLFDGFPVPLCNIKKYKKSNFFRGEEEIGYCTTKDVKYFGFKGHFPITQEEVTRSLFVAAAHIDECDILSEVSLNLREDVIEDKELIRPELIQVLKNQGLRIHTPLRKNMNDVRLISIVFFQIMNIYRNVETVIGKLVDIFRIQEIKLIQLDILLILGLQKNLHTA